MTALNEKSSRWLRRFHAADDAAVRLVCLPHAGGSATAFFPFSRAAAEGGLDADVIAVQYPGRQDRRDEPCFDELAAMADVIADDLGPWIDRPVALFGHSMGATLGYEVACRLEARGTRPLGLFASACPAPSVPRGEYVHELGDDGLITALKEISGTGSADSAVFGDDELLRMVLPAIRGDYTAVETYRPEPGLALDCPVQVLLGADDPVVDLAEVTAWRGHTSGHCAVQVLEGGHFYLNAQLDDVLTTVAARLRDWRVEALASATPDLGWLVGE
ncbi:Surfactin synthase thioesterase subunit [Amycolatopsis pretoriensis]|uniref:Surfactin synthase thioesterase subunit n=1 Tax=Amycolatopsis pretoriensis TaxID=218821 RepID=A0A1H5RDC2_9PSEU|nr:alpha/beta fold hydrolase [Amycolatopsis pretoriensis]SEF36343.1 Surfactin synthase thioesterase subunit [Amycolatopsis pretoriensis]